MDKQEILNALTFRHACKVFDPERRISEEDFTYILEAGRLSPSSFGLEGWRCVVLQNPELRNRLLPVTWGGQKSIPTASHFVLLLARTKQSMMPDSDFIKHMKQDIQHFSDEVFAGFQERYRKFLESDFGLIGDRDERLVFEWTSRQAYIALGNMMTAAALIGIDSCPIEGFQKQEVEAILQEAGAMEQNGDFGLSCMVAFGYRVQEPRVKTRRPMDEVVKWVN